jgi:transposase
MMGRQTSDQASLFYEFRLDERVPKNHLLRRINIFVTAALADVHGQLGPYYSEMGRPSVDPELMIRMLIVGYCYGLRSERKLTQEVELHLAYRWFCRLDLDDKVPHHSTFSENRLHRFRESDVFRHIFERVVAACMAAGLVKGEGFAVDASVMEANASRYHGKAPDEIEWAEPERQTRAVKEYLAALDADAEPNPDRKPPKVISPSDPCAAWTAKANKRVQFGYGINYLVDIENAVIVDVEPTPARTYDEVESTKTMLDRTERRFNLKPKRLAADTAYGTGRSSAGWSAVGSCRTSQFVTPASAPMALSLAMTFAGIGGGAFTSAPTTRCCTPLAGCTKVICFGTAPPSLIAMSAPSRCSAARTCRRDRSPAIFMRTPAIWRAA